jgi:hypothetical protein
VRLTMTAAAPIPCELCSRDAVAELPQEARYFVRLRGHIEVRGASEPFEAGNVCAPHAERLDDSNAITFVVRL